MSDAQLDAFAPWRQARTGDPDTSREAATRNADGLVVQRMEVLAALRLLGARGGTIYEVAARGARMGYIWDAVAAARRLYEAGELREAVATPGRRPNPRGTATCRVWIHARFAGMAG